MANKLSTEAILKARLVQTRSAIKKKFQQHRNSLSRDERNAKIKYTPITDAISQHMQAKSDPLTSYELNTYGEDDGYIDYNNDYNDVASEKHTNIVDTARDELKPKIEMEYEDSPMETKNTKQPTKRNTTVRKSNLTRYGKHSMPMLQYPPNDLTVDRLDQIERYCGRNTDDDGGDYSYGSTTLPSKPKFSY